jgi:hypothetical protein
MELGTTEATPDLDELLQEEPLGVTVPVRGEGTFLTQALPARRVQAATDLIPAGSWTALLPGTPKRSRTILLSTDKAFRVSPNGTGLGMLWPASVPLELRHTEPVYVMADDPAGATVSHLTELWAD